MMIFFVVQVDVVQVEVNLQIGRDEKVVGLPWR